MSEEMPEGWECVQLRDVSHARLGKTPRKKDYRDEGKHRIIKFRDVQDTRLVFFESKAGFVVDEVAALRGLRPLNVGDTLVTASAHSSESIGKKCAFVDRLPSVDGGVFFVGELLGVTVNATLMDSKWPYLWLLSSDGIEATQAAVFGVHLTAGRAQEIPIPLPPLAEQQRIVAKVEELLASVNTARQRLAQAPAILKRFRQSVLAAACSGRLTTDWREEHSDVEPATILNDRICKERELRLKGERRSKLESNESEFVDSGVLLELPETWHKTSLAAVTWRLTYGITVRPGYVEDGVPIISAREIRSGEIDIGIAKRISQSDYQNLREKCRIYFADILFGKTGSIGAVARVRTKIPLCSSQNIAVLSPLIESAFLELVLRSPSIQQLAADSVKDTAIPDLQLGFMAMFPVLLPPELEQHEIVRRVEALFKLADAIEKRVTVATVRAEKLTQAILAKAFRGELVPTEAELARREGRDYEPASALLERVRAENAMVTNNESRKRRRAGRK